MSRVLVESGVSGARRASVDCGISVDCGASARVGLSVASSEANGLCQ